MHPLKQVEDLTTELNALMAEVQASIDICGRELAQPGRTDAARILTAISELTVLTRKFLFLLPEISNARAAEVDAFGPLSTLQAHKWSELVNNAYRLRTWTTQWPTIEKMIRSQIPQKRRKLFKKPLASDDILVTQNMVNDKLFDELHKILNGARQDDTARDHGCFADISLPQSLFLELTHAARRILLARRINHPARFLDVGCGGGLKVLSAATFFDRADGLEFDPGYVDAAKTLFEDSRADRCQVIHADGLTYPHYDTYDVVYFYRPMRHIDLLRQLEDQIISSVRPGTLIIAPYTMFDYRYKELGCARIERQIYITQTSQSDADKLRRAAELTGNFALVASAIQPSIWDPVLKASRVNGFEAIL